MKNKNLSIALVVGFVLLVVVAAFFFLRPKGEVDQEVEPAEKTRLEITDVPLEEQPFLVLYPISGGQKIGMEISNFGQVEGVEYELTYLSEGFSRGAIGSVKVDSERVIEKELLLGSCSSGTCKYDKDVEGGSLTLRIKDDEGTKKLVSGWQLHQNEEVLVSADEFFQISNPSFEKGTFIVASTLGLPGPVETGEVVAGPYGVFGDLNNPKNLGVSFVPQKELTNPVILVWDGKQWEELDTGPEGGAIIARTNTLGVYLLIDNQAPAEE